MTCKWVWSDSHEVWQTTCGGELLDDDRGYLDSELGMTHCLWCGKHVEYDDSEMGRMRREEEAALRRAYWEAVLPR